MTDTQLLREFSWKCEKDIEVVRLDVYNNKYIYKIPLFSFFGDCINKAAETCSAELRSRVIFPGFHVIFGPNFYVDDRADVDELIRVAFPTSSYRPGEIYEATNRPRTPAVIGLFMPLKNQARDQEPRSIMQPGHPWYKITKENEKMFAECMAAAATDVWCAECEFISREKDTQDDDANRREPCSRCNKPPRK